MTARNDTSLSEDQLCSFAKAFSASKRDLLAKDRPWLATRGETPQERYEAYRDVAVLSMEAARDCRSVFEDKAILALAEQADIPADLVAANLLLLQQAVARGTAAYCMTRADDLRPAESARGRLGYGYSDPGRTRRKRPIAR